MAQQQVPNERSAHGQSDTSIGRKGQAGGRHQN
ncbi:hypothetical protein IMAU50151_01591 [Lactobacillus helveticus]|nr:hypothetical protein [Lactobacillus helveticus]NRO29201.1 hypothetical protein [Lactobacillus helveticus]